MSEAELMLCNHTDLRLLRTVACRAAIAISDSRWLEAGLGKSGVDGGRYQASDDRISCIGIGVAAPSINRCLLRTGERIDDVQDAVKTPDPRRGGGKTCPI